MVSVRTSRRGHGEDSIYFDAEKNRYVGAVSLGHAGDGTRVRRKVYGKTKQDVRLKLKTLRSDIEAGVRAPASYTVQAAVDDWLAQGLSGRSERTLTLYRDAVKPLTDKIGARQLRQLTAAEVRSALAGLSGELSTRSLQIARNCLVRAIRQAQADDIVARNVAALVKTPAGREGRPSKALTAEQAQALVKAAAGVLRANGMRKRRGPYRLHAYVVLLLTTGIRPLRHTFVSIMSQGGMPVEEIARLAGHKQTSTTELVYRRELRPVITTGAELMDTVFSS